MHIQSASSTVLPFGPISSWYFDIWRRLCFELHRHSNSWKWTLELDVVALLKDMKRICTRRWECLTVTCSQYHGRCQMEREKLSSSRSNRKTWRLKRDKSNLSISTSSGCLADMRLELSSGRTISKDNGEVQKMSTMFWCHAFRVLRDLATDTMKHEWWSYDFREVVSAV